MALTVKNNTKVAVMVEVTEGVYVAPAADTDYVQTLSDGTELTPAKELLEREIFNGSIGKSTPRTGTRSVSGALPVEFRAADTEGNEPEYDKLLRACLGSRRQVEDNTSTTAHTTSVINMAAPDAAEYQVNDIVLVKEAGAYHVSPISAVGATSITLLIPAAAPFSDAVVVESFTTYRPADSGHPSLSISKYVEDARLEQAVGCRVTSMALENFTTGQLASWNFGFEGLTFDQSLTAIPHSPNYQDSLPPVILNACLYQDGVEIDINELTLNIENTLGFATSTCSSNGRISGRVTSRVVSGTFNPYKQDNDIGNFNKFKNNTPYSLFAYAYNPTGVAGQFNNVCAIYMPYCITTELGEADQDGLLQENISFSASRGQSGENEEVVISFV